jgi:superfamily II DNA/RNA helicase
LDLIRRGNLDLSQLNHVVLDEVDRMLDMGFADDVDAILKERYSEGLFP